MNETTMIYESNVIHFYSSSSHSDTQSLFHRLHRWCVLINSSSHPNGFYDTRRSSGPNAHVLILETIAKVCVVVGFFLYYINTQ